MSVLADYTPEEQALLLRSVRAAAIAISAASLGRKAETASEGFAAASYVLEERQPYLSNTLIGSIQYYIDQRAQSDAKFASYEDEANAPDAEAAALAALRDVAALLAAKSTPEEAAGFKQWLMNIAAKTTEAGKEGGNFMGWGAVQVNDAERAALQEIAQALGIAT